MEIFNVSKNNKISVELAQVVHSMYSFCEEQNAWLAEQALVFHTINIPLFMWKCTYKLVQDWSAIVTSVGLLYRLAPCVNNTGSKDPTSLLVEALPVW